MPAVAASLAPDNMTRRRALWLAAGLLVAGVLAYAALRETNPLRVQLLDVTGYRDPMPVWMVLRVNLGLSNTGRDLLSIRSVRVEPDFAGFNEAFNIETLELHPPLVVEPGHSATYQAATTLLNANQLPEGRRDLLLRVRITRQDGIEQVYEFPADFDHAREPARRAIRF